MKITMREDEVFDRVKKTISNMLQVFNRDISADLTKETNINADLGVDSVELLDLLGALEKEFGIPIEAEKVVGVKTIDDFVKFIVNAQK